MRIVTIFMATDSTSCALLFANLSFLPEQGNPAHFSFLFSS